MQNFAIFVLAVFFAASGALAQSEVEGQTAAAAATAVAGDGQEQSMAALGAPEAAISTQLTVRSHTIGASTSASFLEGNACPGPTKMVSGACHPGFNDQVLIINQYPNVSANTWRCGFRNNNSFSRTVWIYTLCAQ